MVYPHNFSSFQSHQYDIIQRHHHRHHSNIKVIKILNVRYKQITKLQKLMLKQKKGSLLSNCSKHSRNKNSLLLVSFLSFFIFLCRKIFSFFSKYLLTFSSQSSCIKSSNKQLNVSSYLKSFSTYAY